MDQHTNSQPTSREITSLLSTLDLGKVSFAQAVLDLVATETEQVPIKRQSTEASPLTAEQVKAIEMLPEVFGQVSPAEPRALTQDEAERLVNERHVIDVVLSVLSNRKDKTIREALANHLDATLEAEGAVDSDTPRSKDGHYLVKSSAKVPGAAKTIDATVSNPSPKVSSALLLDMFENGDLTREEYLSVTAVPEVARDFDEQKARKAIKKNPALLAKIAKATTRSAPTFTVKVNPIKE